MRAFFLRLLGQPTFEQDLVTRLLDQNALLLDRLLERNGVEPLVAKSIVEPIVPARSEIPTTTPEREKFINEYAHDAASDPELMEQAVANAEFDTDWREVVKRAEALMQPVY